MTRITGGQRASAHTGAAQVAAKQRTHNPRKRPPYGLHSRSVAACADGAAAAQGPGSKQKIPGLRKFINGIWDRKRHVPNNLYKDPLVTLFEDFDLNKDGMLTVDEITSALQSEGVQITPEQVETFVQAADENENKVVDSHEFSRLIFKLADESAGDSDSA